MKVRVTNNGKAPYGIEQVGGGYMFVAPGATRTPDAVNPGPLYDKPYLDVEAADSEVTAMPASLRTRAKQPIVPTVDEVLKAEVVEEKPDPLDHDGDGSKGGSLKGPTSTVAKGARRRNPGKARRR